MVGLFINTLPVRVRVEEDELVEDALRKVQEQFARSREFEYVPLFKIQGWADVEGGRGLFSTVLVTENYPAKSGLSDHSSAPIEIESGISLEVTNYPLVIAIMNRSNLVLDIQFHTSKYSKKAVVSIANALKALLLEMASNSRVRVGDLAILSRDDFEMIVVKWNNRTAPLPVHQWHTRCLNYRLI